MSKLLQREPYDTICLHWWELELLLKAAEPFANKTLWSDTYDKAACDEEYDPATDQGLNDFLIETKDVRRLRDAVDLVRRRAANLDLDSPERCICCEGNTYFCPQHGDGRKDR